MFDKTCVLLYFWETLGFHLCILFFLDRTLLTLRGLDLCGVCKVTGVLSGSTGRRSER